MGQSLDDIVSDYFQRPQVVQHYLRATAGVGLWRSEETLIRRYFEPTETLLELGCGTGRIALAMHELGYRHLLGVDLFRPMVEQAREAARALEYGVSFQVADACRLPFEDGLFDGAIFGFNGLMHLAGRSRRATALSEIRRIVAPGGHFLFTTHDRQQPQFQDFWAIERERWAAGEQDPRLEEFGDRIVPTDGGEVFIHIPERTEMEALLAEAGWELVLCAPRHEVAEEPPEVRAFSDECIFWVAR